MTDDEMAEVHRRIGEVFCNAICVGARLGHKRLSLTMSTYVHTDDDEVAALIAAVLVDDDVSAVLERSAFLQEHTRRMVQRIGEAVQ